MKSLPHKDCWRGLGMGLVLTAALTLARGQLPAGAVLGIAPGIGGSNLVTVTIADPGNNVWLLQSSTT
jgi:hypothetical protein